ncbi:MAG: DUF4832 domain-containing protein [Paludibacteraceae bacterium]|nr:DUF4832 domain-containing protein [Paludibacteraceae bacterium]
MKTAIFSTALIAAIVLTSCHKPETEPAAPTDPEGTVYFTELDSVFPNPEKGFHVQSYFSSQDLSKRASAKSMITERNGEFAQTLYLHSYYLTDYIESDIPQTFLDRMQDNFDSLRAGGAKAVIRLSYKDNEAPAYKPWDATPEWANRHIDQVAPVLNKNADVILCFQAGFVGVWGEWYYTTGFKMNPKTDAEYQPRWDLLNHELEAFPHDRQICLRTPGYKMRYLQQMGLDVLPLDEYTAHKGDAKSRLGGHNDCFISDPNDVGTYSSTEDRDFWQKDTRYTLMGGETCRNCKQSAGDNAIKQMQLYHWTYIHRSYVSSVVWGWKSSGHFPYIVQHLGYHLVMEKAYCQVNANNYFVANVKLHNDGFAAPQNARNVELILVKGDEKHVYKQNIDPRFWIPENKSFEIALLAEKTPDLTGTYTVYLNLPDPYPSLHDDPRYSIRMYNKDVWEESTGYNKLGEYTFN